MTSQVGGSQSRGTQALSSRRTNSTVAVLVASFGAFLAFLDVTIVNVAFPSIQQSFPHASFSSLSWVLNSYNIVFAALLVAAGRLADVFGRRRTFASGIFLFTAASALCAAAPTINVLIAGRVIQAVGAGLLVPASLGLVIQAFPIERRTHAVGIWAATGAVAAGVGPALGGALVDLYNWRLAFVVNLPLGLVALLATRSGLVESRAPGRRTLPDLRGAALLAGSMGLLTLGIVQGPTWGWTTIGVIGSFVGAVVLLGLFVQSSRNHPVPVLDPRLLRIRTFAVSNVVIFLFGVGFYAYMLNNVLWLKYVWGYSILITGLAVAPAAFIAAAVAIVMGKVADRRGHRVIAVPGAIIWAGAYVWYVTQVGTHPDFVGAWLPGQILSGIGVGAALPIVTSAAVASVPGGRYATASAVVSSIRQLGGALGVALLVVLIGTPTALTLVPSLRHGWDLSIICFALGAVVSLALGRAKAATAEHSEPLQPPEIALRSSSGRLDRTSDGSPLARSSLLSRLPFDAGEALLRRGTSVTRISRDWLFRQGDPTDALYVIISGRLEVVRDGELVRELGAGDVVGELGVLTGAPRQASVRARRDTQLVRIAPESVEEVLRQDPSVLRALTNALANQVQRGSTSSEEVGTRQPSVVSVVGLAEDVPANELADALGAEMSEYWSTVVSRGASAGELQRLETEHDRVLLVSTDPTDAQWRSFCLRQSDRVILVAGGDTAPPQFNEQFDCYAVLAGRPNRSRLAQWHDTLAPWFLYQTDASHADRTQSDGFQPRVAQAVGPQPLSAIAANLARRLCGRSIGVTIGGGGARSLAGIGVVEELIRAGYQIDRFSGCSFGAIVAAFFATGRDPAAVDAACYEELVRHNPLNDYAIPRVAVTRGHKVESGISRSFGEITFEELPLELALVSTDLLRRTLVVHRRGPLAHALRASVSMPGLFPPVEIGGSLHVDGAVLDNLPVEALSERDEGPIVAINFGAGLSGSIRQGPLRRTSLGETLLRSILMGGARALDRAKQQATVLVTPDTRQIGLLEFHQIDQAREAGLSAGAAAVDALRAAMTQPTGTTSTGRPTGVTVSAG